MINRNGETIMSQITITIGTPDTLDTKDFVFEIDDALNMGFKHEYCMWTAEPKHGWWIIEDDTERFIARCSVCGKATDSRMIGRFCPNCGARMEEENGRPD